MSDDNALTVQAEGGGVTDFLSLIERLATNPAVQVDKLSAIMDLQQRVNDRKAAAAFNAALAAAQREVPPIPKNGVIDMGNKGKIPFAKYEDMDKVLRPIMEKYGFSITFDMQPREGGGGIITGTLMHELGHKQTASLPLPSDQGAGRNSLQAVGSTLSYAKRYIFEMFFRIVREGVDDDGVAGGKKYVTEAQAEELRALCKEAGRVEGQILDRLFSGAVRAFEEVEAGAFVVVKNTLQGIVEQRKRQGSGDAARA